MILDAISQVLKTSGGDEFPEMATKLEALIKFLGSFPTSGEVDMCEGFNAGTLKVGNFQWLYQHMPQVAAGHVEFRAKAQPEMHPFFTVGGAQPNCCVALCYRIGYFVISLALFCGIFAWRARRL